MRASKLTSTVLTSSLALFLIVALAPGAAAGVSADPEASVQPNAGDPAESTGEVSTSATVKAADLWVSSDAQVNVGEYTSCAGFFCQHQDGHQATTYNYASAGGETVVLQGTATLVEDESEPAGYGLGTTEVGCSHNGDPC